MHPIVDAPLTPSCFDVKVAYVGAMMERTQNAPGLLSVSARWEHENHEVKVTKWPKQKDP
jgi:hypothetical protein